jgi:hypothetical protein
MKTFLKVFWIVFAFLSLLIIIGGILVIARSGFPFKDLLPLIAAIPSVIAIFAYAFRKKVWPSGVYVWRVYFFALIALNIYQDWSMFSKNSNMPLESWIEYGITLILVIITYIGMYLYAFKFLKTNRESLTS